jgi:hypothetical protein
MKLTVILFTILFIGISCSSFGQIINLAGADGRPILQEKRNDIDGSPYFSESFESSKIHLKRNPGERETLGRLNFLNNTFEFKNDGDLLEIPFSDIKYLTTQSALTSEELFFENGENLGLNKNGLFLSLFKDQKISLYKEFSYKLSDVQSDSYSQTEGKRKVMISENLYLLVEGKPMPVKRNLKSFSSVLPTDYQKALAQYSKETKINWKEDKDLVGLLEYLANT